MRRDDTVLDCVSHTRVKTPTAAAEYLINHLHDTAKVLEDYASAVLHTISTRMERENTRLNRMVERIPMQTQIRLKEEHYRQERIMKHLEVGLQSRLNKRNPLFKNDGNSVGHRFTASSGKGKASAPTFGAGIEGDISRKFVEKGI